MACANDAQRIRFLVTRHQHTDAQGRDGQAPLEEVLSTNSKTVEAPEPSIPVVEATRKSSVNPDTSEDSRFARHLNAQLSPLKFPPEMARRILTHASHKKAPIDGHNARMSFIGMSFQRPCNIPHAHALSFRPSCATFLFDSVPRVITSSRSIS